MTQTLPKASEKYLRHYAETEASLCLQLDAVEARRYVLVIPAYREEIAFIERLSTREDAGDISLVLVVNEPDSDTPGSDNDALLAQLYARSELHETCQHLQLLMLGDLQILLIKRCRPEQALAKDQSVGLARKIGSDVACALIYNTKVACQWIYSSDADAYLPEDYFSAATSNTASAIVYNFEHICAGDLVGSATSIYQRCLYYFREQLQLAGSPYAFHTLGSCLAIAARHYCQARGFPKRSAGEDFYLLNKLAKLGSIAQLNSVNIRIEARYSDRVPFGTGPAVSKIARQLESGETPSYYAPEIFQELRSLLDHQESIWNRAQSVTNEIAQVKAVSTRDCLAELSGKTQAALLDLGFDTFMNKRMAEDRTLEAFERSFHIWFDAFRTLKFIHFMQNHYYSAVSIEEIF